MKKSFIFSLVIFLILINQLDAQKGGLLKKAGNSMANELLGRKEKAEPEPEPASACVQPDLPRVAEFEAVNDGDKTIEGFILKNKPYISKSGEKLLITFGGKTYGPYAQINAFTLTKTKEKFAAIVVENVLTTEAEGKQMEKAMDNAKTDQEKMDLAMQYAQQMQQK